jgi:cytochrome c oxidase subunit 1
MRSPSNRKPDGIGTLGPTYRSHPAEVPETELYHPHSWWTTYVFSQDVKVIAVPVV